MKKLNGKHCSFYWVTSGSFLKNISFEVQSFLKKIFLYKQCLYEVSVEWVIIRTLSNYHKYVPWRRWKCYWNTEIVHYIKLFAKTDPLGGKLSLPSCCSYQSTFKKNFQRKRNMKASLHFTRNSVYSNVCYRANLMVYLPAYSEWEKTHTKASEQLLSNLEWLFSC